MIRCTHCGFWIPDDMIDDEFIICPYCEEEVEVEVATHG